MRTQISRGNGRRLTLLMAVVSGLALNPGTGVAGDFSVRPVRIFLTPDARNTVLQITNNGTEPLAMQLRAYRWSQDESGEDLYEDTDEIVYFPRIVTLEPGAEQLVRIGVQTPQPAVEGTFRIYLQELPDGTPGEPGAVRALVRVGVPVFVQPGSSTDDVRLKGLALQDCSLRLQIENAGTLHTLLQTISLAGWDEQGELLFQEPLKGWYLLPGTERTYSHELDESSCAEVSRMRARVETGQEVLELVAERGQ